MPHQDQDGTGGGRKLAPHVQAALAGGAQPKMPDAKPGAKPMAPHVQAALGQGAVQRMEETKKKTVNLSRVNLSGDYSNMLKCLGLYSSSYVNTHPTIERNLKIGQFLKLTPPRVNFHCSGKPGTGKDKVRAKQSQTAYETWLKKNKSKLNAVTVTGGGQSSGRKGLYDPSLHEKKKKEKFEKQRGKQQKRKGTHREKHEQQGHVFVGWPALGAWKCKECNQWYQ